MCLLSLIVFATTANDISPAKAPVHDEVQTRLVMSIDSW